MLCDLCLKIGTHTSYDTSRVRAKGFRPALLPHGDSPRKVHVPKFKLIYVAENFGTIVTYIFTNFQTQWLKQRVDISEIVKYQRTRLVQVLTIP